MGSETPKQCPTCGHITRDWSQEGAVRNELGHKIDGDALPDIREDRTAAYRKFRRTITQAGATDFDQVEWRYVKGVLTPAALFELTRVDGNVPVGSTYLQSILDRMMERDWQGGLAKTGAEYLKVKAWIVAFRHDLTEFWVYNITDGRGWFRMSTSGYSFWIASLRPNISSK